jgi:hypothetical protein
MNGQEQVLYDHLLGYAQSESPSQLIDRFRSLFIEGCGYPELEIWQALADVVNSPAAEHRFKFVLNRSSHILINQWLMQPRLHSAIPALIELFDSPQSGMPRSHTSKRLHELRTQFRETEQYSALNRLSRVMIQEQSTENRPLGSLIHRYPLLYEHSLLTPDTVAVQGPAIRRLRNQSQHQFERELSRYIAHQQRLTYGHVAENIRFVSSSSTPSGSQSGPRIIKNPTLLSDRQLDTALRQFTGKVDGRNTYRELARQFLTYTSDTPCYRIFKQDLYHYLVSSVDPSYGSRQFNQRLSSYLQTMSPDSDNQKLSDVLLVGTCRKLLNFLVVDVSRLHHAVFVDLTANLGITATIGLLLKILLLCTRVKPYLEKQFSVLFGHYEDFARDAVKWLIESLENLNVAFATNFGRINLVYR